MRATTFAFVILSLFAPISISHAQQTPAIPTTVRALVNTPPRIGQLIQVSGFLVTSDKEPKLQDTDNNRKVVLDFSRSSVTLEMLGANPTSAPPVLIIGRMQGTKDNGKPIIGVLGATKLTR